MDEPQHVPGQQSNHDLPVIEVSLNIDASLGHILDSTGPLHAEVLQSVQQQLGDVVHLLGIPGQVVLDIRPLTTRTSDDIEWMRLRVNGTLCRYSQEVLISTWSSAAGRPADATSADIHSRLQAAADAQAKLPPLAQWWILIRRWLRAAAGLQGGNEVGQAARFLGLACREIISRQPAVLLGPAQVAAYSARLERVPPDLRPDTSRLTEILKRVVQLRISIADTGTVARVLADSEGTQWEDIFEDLVDALAPHAVELRVPEAYVARLTTPDENGSDLLALLRESMFDELGVALPPFRLVPTTQLKSNSFTLVINHLPTLPVVGLEANECLVNVTPERLRQMDIEGRKAVHPATQQPAAVVDVATRELLEADDLTTWDQAHYCMLCFAEALRRNCASFVHRRLIEIQLEHLSQAFPALVEVVCAKMSVEQITRVLRALSSEQISIRSLQQILERLLDYQYRTSDLERYSILDDRFSDLGDLQDQRTDDLVAFTRAGLKRQISDKYARGTSTLSVSLLDQEFENLFDGAETDVALEEERQESILTALATELNHLPPARPMPPILTTIGVRASLYDAVKLTFPRIGVLAYQELRPNLNIQPVVRISLPRQV